MMKRMFLAALSTAALAHAGLVRMEIKERSDVLDGRSFGTTGAYERIVGKAYFALDPKLEVNRLIVDLDRAPRNKDGLVEFSSDFYILRPKDSKKGNGAVFYEASNRGNKSLLPNFNRAPNSVDPRKPEE